MEKRIMPIVLSAIFILVLTAVDASSGEKLISSFQTSGPGFKVEKVWGYSMHSPGAAGVYRGWKNRGFGSYPSYNYRWYKGYGLNGYRHGYRRGYRMGYRDGFRDGIRESHRNGYARDSYDCYD